MEVTKTVKTIIKLHLDYYEMDLVKQGLEKLKDNSEFKTEEWFYLEKMISDLEVI